MKVMRPSRWSVLVRLDAAWLDVEADDLAGAIDALDGTFRWTEQHPIGLCVQARLHYACGRLEQAVAAQRQVIDRGWATTTQQRLLMTAYQDAASGESIILADAERLPSVA